jgi:hypothetical protein
MYIVKEVQEKSKHKDEILAEHKFINNLDHKNIIKCLEEPGEDL